jgi:hypothetical protein
MSQSWRARATVLLLIAGVLGGGAGAPVFDALLYHHDDGAHAQHLAHLEPRGTRHAHADACTLGWLLTVQPSTSSAVQPGLLAAQLLVASAPFAIAAPWPTRLLSSQHSRAPPARSA